MMVYTSVLFATYLYSAFAKNPNEGLLRTSDWETGIIYESLDYENILKEKNDRKLSLRGKPVESRKRTKSENISTLPKIFIEHSSQTKRQLKEEKEPANKEKKEKQNKEQKKDKEEKKEKNNKDEKKENNEKEIKNKDTTKEDKREKDIEKTDENEENEEDKKDEEKKENKNNEDREENEKDENDEENDQEKENKNDEDPAADTPATTISIAASPYMDPTAETLPPTLSPTASNFQTTETQIAYNKFIPPFEMILTFQEATVNINIHQLMQETSDFLLKEMQQENSNTIDVENISISGTDFLSSETQMGNNDKAFLLSGTVDFVGVTFPTDLYFIQIFQSMLDPKKLLGHFQQSQNPGISSCVRITINFMENSDGPNLTMQSEQPSEQQSEPQLKSELKSEFQENPDEPLTAEKKREASIAMGLTMAGVIIILAVSNHILKKKNPDKPQDLSNTELSVRSIE